jgi:hypothetical protein
LDGETPVNTLRWDLIGGAIIVGRHSLIGITSDVRLTAVDGGLIYRRLIIIGLVTRARDRVRVGIIPRGWGWNILLLRGIIPLGVDLIRAAPGVGIRKIIQVISPRAIFDFPL